MANHVRAAPITAAIASLSRRALVLRRSVSMSLYDTPSGRALQRSVRDHATNRTGVTLSGT
jgi:hypothetical protein